MTVDTGGIDTLLSKLERAEQQLPARLAQKAQDQAVNITDSAKALVYQQGLRYRDGQIANSLHPYAAQTEGGVTFGVETNDEVAVYQELGTGPVGTAAGYPGEGAMNRPIARKSKGWTYWSDDVAAQRAEEQPDGGEANGFVFTEGVPAKAFMHNGMMQEKEDALRAIQDVIKELYD